MGYNEMLRNVYTLLCVHKVLFEKIPFHKMFTQNILRYCLKVFTNSITHIVG